MFGLDPRADDVLLPDGIASPPKPGDHQQISADARLLFAIIEQAICDYLGHDQYRARDAANWFTSHDDDVQTFRWVCAMLGLDADYIWRHRGAWHLDHRWHGSARGAPLRHRQAA